MRDRKKKPLKILFSLSGESSKASSRVRGFWIAEALEEQGVHCTLRFKRGKSELLRFALETMRHDVVIFQKNYSRYHRWLMVFANGLGKKTYLDIDDAPSKIQSSKTLGNIQSMMQQADGVFAGSQKLFDYAKSFQANVYLIPSGINLKHYHVATEDENTRQICLGWIGNGKHYAKDLMVILATPLRALASKYELKFKLIGAGGVKELYDEFSGIPDLEIEFLDEIEWSNPAAVSEALEDIDIGLYPLIDNEFNRYKCGFKALEYMAMGIPVVSSRVAENVEILTNNKDGLIAESSNEWVSSIEMLIRHSDIRREMGRNGRQKVEAEYSTKIISNKLVGVISQSN